MIGVVVEPKFRRPGLDPRSVFGASKAASEKLLTLSTDNVNVSYSITAGVPSDRRLAIWGHRRNRVRISAKDHSGDRRLIR